MTRSDIGTIITIYATALLFYCLAIQLRPSAQIYPLCLIGALALLNTLYLGRCLMRLLRNGSHRIVNDLPEVFKGFMARQFIFVVFACTAYLALLHYAGFYLASLIFLTGVLAYLKVRPLPLIITTAVMGSLIYSVFTLLLKVPLPKGVLFS
ncbi:MAG: tripartite tricarboxylate transporter TctB family protein [Desulfovibrio sp.]|nr:tripartite tricarboxylate transporter TctB family protein [Desulfovibrio sp.]